MVSSCQSTKVLMMKFFPRIRKGRASHTIIIQFVVEQHGKRTHPKENSFRASWRITEFGYSHHELPSMHVSVLVQFLPISYVGCHLEQPATPTRFSHHIKISKNPPFSIKDSCGLAPPSVWISAKIGLDFERKWHSTQRTPCHHWYCNFGVFDCLRYE